MSKYTPKDFSSDREIKWCPGCGDYSILKQVQNTLPEIDVKKEDIVFISGIGCSSRFPYYMDVYGLHGIHGRAFPIATGVKMSNPNLSVWVISGDGDSFSIGGNHLIHCARRDLDLNILIFNNEIYGLTKGQFSPTSKIDQKTKSSPFGVKDNPFNPVKLLIGGQASFVARTMDVDIKNFKQILLAAHSHKGSSFVEIYQNCNVFNDRAFDIFSNKQTRDENCIFLENGRPLIFGKDRERGIKLDGYKPVIVDIKNDNISENELWIHDQTDETKAFILSNMFENTDFPRPFGIFYQKEKQKFSKTIPQKDISDILKGDSYWTIN